MRKVSSYSYLFLGAMMTMASHAQAAKQYVVGVSNTLVGNGWREEMVCSIKAEALASGKVSKVILANRNGGPSEQIADLLRPSLHVSPPLAPAAAEPLARRSRKKSSAV